MKKPSKLPNVWEGKREAECMPYKDLIIINNEKIFIENDNFYCDNLDLKILHE